MPANNYQRQPDEPLDAYDLRLQGLAARAAAERANNRPASQMTPSERAERLDELLKPTPLQSSNPADYAAPPAETRAAFLMTGPERKAALQRMGIYL
jgi:hypothetical protein